jgi:hypothetical protein
MRHAYPLYERYRIAVGAVFSGKGPLVEIAREGLRRGGLPESLQVRYALRLIRRPELYFDSIAGTDISDKARGAAKLEFKRLRQGIVFVFDE